VGAMTGLGGVRKIWPPTGIRSPDRPADTESQYRLSYRGLYKVTIGIYCDSRTKPIHGVRSCLITVGGTYSYH
jgi:hypothetical protein